MSLFQRIDQPILTPCIGICSLNDQGYCEGCWRSGDEIAQWGLMSPAQRRYLMDEMLPLREADHG